MESAVESPVGRRVVVALPALLVAALVSGTDRLVTPSRPLDEEARHRFPRGPHPRSLRHLLSGGTAPTAMPRVRLSAPHCQRSVAVALRRMVLDRVHGWTVAAVPAPGLVVRWSSSSRRRLGVTAMPWGRHTGVPRTLLLVLAGLQGETVTSVLGQHLVVCWCSSS